MRSLKWDFFRIESLTPTGRVMEVADAPDARLTSGSFTRPALFANSLVSLISLGSFDIVSAGGNDGEASVVCARACAAAFDRSVL